MDKRDGSGAAGASAIAARAPQGNRGDMLVFLTVRATVAPLLYSAEALASEDHDEAEELLLVMANFNANLDLQWVCAPLSSKFRT